MIEYYYAKRYLLPLFRLRDGKNLAQYNSYSKQWHACGFHKTLSDDSEFTKMTNEEAEAYLMLEELNR